MMDNLSWGRMPQFGIFLWRSCVPYYQISPRKRFFRMCSGNSLRIIHLDNIIMLNCQQSLSPHWLVNGKIYGASCQGAAAAPLLRSYQSFFGQGSDATGSWPDQWAAMIVSVQILAVWWFLSCLQGCSYPCLLSESTLSKLQPLESCQLAVRALKTHQKIQLLDSISEHIYQW